VTARLGIEIPSAQYLSDYVKEFTEIPPISLDAVMRASGLIEKMGRERLRKRQEGEE